MKNKLIALVAALAIIAGGIFTYFVIASPAEATSFGNCARDNDDNAIIKNGTCNTDELSKKYKENKTKDLPAIFSHYNVPTNFGSAKAGEVRKNGDVVVDGKVVATGAKSVGRQNITGSSKVTIGGKTYYERKTSVSFATNSIKAFVFFDKNGEFKSAVLTSCGNPVTAKPKPKVAYKCEGLASSKIDRTRYDLSVSTSQHRATFQSVTFNVYSASGNKVDSKTSNSKSYRYIQTIPGEYTIKSVVTFKTHDGKTVTSKESDCVTSITVDEEPAYDCDALTASLIGEATDRTYKYNLEYTAENGAELQTVDFYFGDNNSQNGVKPSELGDVTHTYAKEGDYTTTATLKFNVAGSIKSTKCTVQVTASPDEEEPCPYNPELPIGHPDCEEPKEEECKPGVPVGHEDCEEKPEECKPGVPVGSDECEETPETPETPAEEPKGKGDETPEVIPETGAGSLIGAFAGLGSIGAASYYYVASRRELLGKMFNR